jgi:hypothetical protein
MPGDGVWQNVRDPGAAAATQDAHQQRKMRVTNTSALAAFWEGLQKGIRSAVAAGAANERQQLP